MTNTLNIALAQLNPIVGDIAGNVEMLRRIRAEAAKAGADLVVTSELVVCGYPPEDLVLRPSVDKNVQKEVMAIAMETSDGGPAMLIGSPWRKNGELLTPRFYLTAAKSRQSGVNTIFQIMGFLMKNAFLQQAHFQDR